MEFHYKLTIWECMVCGAKRAFRQLFYRPKALRMAALILFGSAVLSGILGIAGGGTFQIWGILFIAYAMLLIGAFLFFIRMPVEAFAVYRQCGKRERTVRIAELYLPVRLMGGRQKQEEFRHYVNDQRRISGDKLAAGVPEEVLTESGGECGICQKWNLNTLTAAVSEAQWLMNHCMRCRRWTDWATRNIAVLFCCTAICLVCIGLTRPEGLWGIGATVLFLHQRAEADVLYGERAVGRLDGAEAVPAGLPGKRYFLSVRPPGHPGRLAQILGGEG